MPASLARTAPARGSKVSLPQKSTLKQRTAISTTTTSATAANAATRGVAASASSTAALSPKVEVTPHLAEFINYDVDTSYVMPLEVRNRSEEILTFRFVAPARHPSIFRLLNPASVRIAPGLAHVLEVEFSTHQAEDYEDVLTVLSSDGGRLAIPLSACRVPQLEFPPRIDFGKVEQQHATQTRTLTLVNRGRKDAAVQFVVVPATNEARSPPRGIAVSSPATVAVAQSRTSVNVELNALPPGEYLWKVAVEVEGRRLATLLEVTAEVLDCRSRLIDPRTQEEVVSLEFAETYAGNVKTHQLEVVNGGSQAISFAIQTAHTLSDDGAAPFHFTPSEGRLPPQGRQLVTAQFCPVLQPRRTGWSNTAATAASLTARRQTASKPNNGTSSSNNGGGGGGVGLAAAAAAASLSSPASNGNAQGGDGAAEQRRYEALFSLLFVETEQTQSFRLVGTSCETLVQLSTSAIDFGPCLMKASKQASLLITNAVAHLPMRFELRPPSHFTVTPARGVVPASGTLEVRVDFHPRRLGPYDEALTLKANDTVTRVVTLRGTSLHRLPSELSTAAATARQARHERALGEAAAAAATVPAAVDLGMIPGEGLAPPQLPRQVPPAALLGDGDGSSGSGSGTAATSRGVRQTRQHVAPPVFGARALVKRRFHTAPATAHERHDCKRELTPMEVLNVVLPLKALDFGRVTVHADVAASLFVFNGTAAAILAGVPTDADGLVTVDPPAQVIPAQRMAQFDVHLCSHTVQTFQQVMRVAINQQHFMRFNIQAEVVPVEVTLSQKEVRMSLLGQAEDPVCTAQVTIGNSGNCAAAYRWQLPPSCEFDVEPRTGVLEAGEQRNVLLRFSPAVGTSQASCEARLEVEGAVGDKVLVLIGTVAPTRCVWGPSPLMTLQESPVGPASSKEVAAISGVLALGRIAAGVPTVGTLVLVNRGKTNAYFDVRQLPPWMTVSPAHGRVCSGEAEELTVRVRHSVAGQVDHTVECMVVGMRKPLTVRVEATVVAPPLIVMAGEKEQSEVLLRFGEVFVGCPQTRSVVLRNTLDVAAAVCVNLEACGHYTLDSAVMELEEGENIAAGPPSLSPEAEGTGGRASSTAAVGDARRSNTVSRGASMRSLSVGDAAAASTTVVGAPLLSAAGPRSSIVVVPPHADYALRLSYNPTTPAATGRCAVRWHQIGADDLHPLPPFMLEAAAHHPPVTLSAAAVTFTTVVVGQRPPSRVLYVRRGKAATAAVRSPSSGSGVEASSGGDGAGGRNRKTTNNNNNSTSAAVGAGALPLPKRPPVAWRLERSDDAQNILVEPSRGVLSPTEEEQAVTLTFLSSCAGEQHTLLELKVDGEEAAEVASRNNDNNKNLASATAGTSAAPCSVCEVNAAAIDPRVRCSTAALMFPAVPLGVAVQTTVLLYNEGYETVHVDYPGTTAPPLEVTFPEGHVMGRSPRDVLPVALTFCSPSPITVRSSIRLRTDAGGYVDIDICGSAVNAITATEAFVAYAAATPTITATPDTPFTWVEDSAQSTFHPTVISDANGRMLCALSPMADRSVALRGRAPHDLVDVVEAEVDWEAEKAWLTAWWNVYVCRTAVSDIVEALQQSRGGLLADMIEQFTGKRPRRTDADVSSSNNNNSSTSNPPGGAASVVVSGAASTSSGRRRTERAGARGATVKTTTSSTATPAAAATATAPHSLGNTTTLLDPAGAAATSAPQAPLPKELRALDALVHYLRSCGGCLSDIELPYLLPLDAYLEYMAEHHRDVIEREVQHLETAMTAAPGGGSTNYGVSGAEETVLVAAFQQRATASWLVLVRECLRLFYIAQVRSTSSGGGGNGGGGSGAAAPSAVSVPPALRERWAAAPFRRTLPRSNIYSEEESTLLRWVEAAMATFAAADRSELRDLLHVAAPQRLEDLRDARRLLAVVLVYVPALGPQLREGLLNATNNHHNSSGNAMAALAAAAAGATLTSAAAASMTATTAGSAAVAAAAAAAAGPVGSAAAPHHDPLATAAVLLGTLQQLGVPGLPTAGGFVSATPTHLVLLLTHLYLYLPKFATSTPVRFSGRALTTLTETVSIDNTTAEQRHYRVLLPEHSPFHTTAEELVVGPRSSATVTFTVVPRTQRPFEGQCILIDCSAQVAPAERAPFVFALTASPTAEPLRTVRVQTPLYEPLQSELQVENPFPSNCVVSLRVSQTRMPSSADAVDAAKASAMPWLGDDIGDGEEGPQQQQQQQQNLSHWRAAHDTPFAVNSDVLSLRRGETTRLPYAFLPLSRGTYRLLLTFHEETEGEFTYAVEATCGWPKPVDAGLELRVEQGELCASALAVKSSNPALERCLKMYEDRAHRTQRTDLTHLLSNATYAVHFVNEQMEGPNPFFTPDSATYTSPSNPAVAGTLPFNFTPQGVGLYRTLVLLRSAADVRLLRLVGECVPKGDCRELQFVCPARQSIAQQITLTNHTTEDWLFAATLEGSGHFSGPHDVRVPAGRSKDYTVKYAPTWITSGDGESASLLLLNSTTGQKHTYALLGKAEAPLSEGILAVDCRAREQEVVEMMVPNIVSQDATYFVKVDLAYAEGEAATLVIPRASTRRYTLQVRPTVGGDYTGRVTFTSPNGRYVWYAVQLHVDPPEKEGTVQLTTDVRTSMVAEVTVTNPLDTPLFFKVQRYGAGLYGANTFQLGPKAAATYGVLFVPTQAGESTGRLSLVSDAVGEFWYELRMKVTEAEPEPLPFATTPLGQRHIMQVHLPNRTGTSCALTVESTNPAAFNVAAGRVVLPPNAETVVDLVFVPNTVEVAQTATVTLRHPELGCWRYACSGTGAAPLPAEPQRCTSAVGATSQVTLPFVNSLGRETAIEVRLRSASTATASATAAAAASAFALRTVPTHPVPAGAAAPITVAFSPTLVQRYDTVVEVRPVVGKTDRACGVVWTFPIEGYCEYRQTKPPLRLRCAARTQWEDKVYLHAPGLTPELAGGVTAAFEVDANQSYRDTAAASVTCALTTPSPYPDGFEAQLKFIPLRPFIGSGWIVVQGVDGGVWRYRVQFEATAAAPDDTITLYGEYKETTSASFDLYNVFPYRSPFFAYFTAESSKDLTVTPTHGVLLPFVPGQRGAATATSLQLTVKPSSRIPQVEGTLVVDTDDMQWIFRVVAKFGHQARATN